MSRCWRNFQIVRFRLPIILPEMYKRGEFITWRPLSHPFLASSMNSTSLSNRSPSSTEPQEEDPGAYPIPFRTCNGVELGSRLDSIPPTLRYWAVNPERANANWVSITTRPCASSAHIPHVPSESTTAWWRPTTGMKNGSAHSHQENIRYPLRKEKD